MSPEYRVTYGEQKYKLSVERQGSDIRISHEGNHYSVTVEETRTAAPLAPVATTATTSAPPAAASPSPSSVPPPSSGSGNGIVAPMTGVIKSIHIAVGDVVQNGQLVITMEAMKMDIQVNASTAGTIAEIRVATGDSVQQNVPLVVLGAAG